MVDGAGGVDIRRILLYPFSKTSALCDSLDTFSKVSMANVSDVYLESKFNWRIQKVEKNMYSVQKRKHQKKLHGFLKL